ncbi:1-hydroxycarotenoid 3,4-desaturase CrtD [Ramlibacter sp.]|uniref:1-hydroxycarotenoid 3,4-desaturase CrtD n=1 Tax=Ramlibacter sp. TaxID=1917967 RepID=UPI003D125834
MRPSSSAIVVGAGVGGLVAALLLAAQGVRVTVLETASGPGGKLRPVTLGGLELDAGPTVFTMRWVFDELFDVVGARLGEHLHLRPVATLARHAWSAEERLDLFADAGRSADAIGTFAGAEAARGYLAFCQRTRRIYQTLEHSFLRGPRPSPLSLVRQAGMRGLPALAGIAPFRSMWSALGDYFRDPRLRQLFGRYATYCGSSPFAAPATLMLVAHVEQQGVWLADGGMRRLATVLAELAAQRGAVLRYGASVAEILVAGGRASGVRLSTGETLAADAVVFNGDARALSMGLLGVAARSAVSPSPSATRSLSAVTWNLLTPAYGFPLLRHNVFFSGDYAAEFDTLRRGQLPADPTLYVCAQDRGDEDAGPPTGVERLLCLVNAAATRDGSPPDADALAQCQRRTFARMERCGLRLSPDGPHVLRTTPAEFGQRFPATGGALYGRASHGWRASFTRPGARSRLDGLYLAGGSTHPGPGVPMAALSGRQAAASVIADMAQAMRRSRA